MEAGPRRRDIDGMRAVAVVLVVGYHGHIPGFRAGFIGVDVFFVISGFIITRLILGEIEATGKLNLAAFWARRARRLLPASNLVFAVCALSSVALLSPFELRTVAEDLLGAALYVSNFVFAFRQGDYFARTAVATSPVLHSWSLAVEEQFYAAWPILLSAASLRVTQRSRIVAFGLAGVAVASFAASVSLSFAGSTWAFYGSPSRAWEFALGGLLALASVRGWSPRRPLRRACAWLGCACLAFGLAVIRDWEPYPGVAALWPVVGTGLIIAGDTTIDGSTLARCLSSAPMQWLGKRSYSWYLWHWPTLVLAERVFSRGIAIGLGAGAASLLLAAVTHVFVENKARFHPRLVASARNTFAVAAGSTVVSAAVALIALWVGDSESTAKILALRKAADDSDRLELRDCGIRDLGALRERCAFGAAGPIRVLLLGDSHARQWSPALAEIGSKEGWRGVFSGMGDCPAILVRVARSTARENVFAACDDWHANLPRLIADIAPSVVVAGSSSYYPPLGWVLAQDGHRLPTGEQIEEWQAGIRRLVALLREAGVPLLFLLDTARLPEHPLVCLAGAAHDDACAAPLEASMALGGRVREAEIAALKRAGNVATFDPLPAMCDGLRCTPKRGDIFVFRDDNHLSASFARSLSPGLAGPLGSTMAMRNP